MKIDKYYIAAGVALLVILIVVFTQRSDWNADRFILSADSKGNLTPVSESYFEGEEKRMKGVVDGKVADLTAWKDRGGFVFIEENVLPYSCGNGRKHRDDPSQCIRQPGQGSCKDQIGCPGGSVIMKDRGSCRCVILANLFR